MSIDQSFEDTYRRLADALTVTVLTGAGVSADSGVPTFRGPDGLWNNFRAEDLATPEAFARDPQLVWEWYNWRRGLIASTRPNAAHHALARLERRLDQRGGRFRLITQNVDGLHLSAGSRRVTEIHGNIWKVRCTACGLVAENRDVPLRLPPRAAAVENYCGPISSGLEKRWLRRIFGTPMPRWNRARFCSSSAHPGSFTRLPHLRPSPNPQAPTSSNSIWKRHLIPASSIVPFKAARRILSPHYLNNHGGKEFLGSSLLKRLCSIPSDVHRTRHLRRSHPCLRHRHGTLADALR